jgi:hypothetical protein
VGQRRAILWLSARIQGNIGFRAAVLTPNANRQRYASRDHSGDNYKHDRDQVGCHVRITRGQHPWLGVVMHWYYGVGLLHALHAAPVGIMDPGLDVQSLRGNELGAL